MGPIRDQIIDQLLVVTGGIYRPATSPLTPAEIPATVVSEGESGSINEIYSRTEVTFPVTVGIGQRSDLRDFKALKTLGHQLWADQEVAIAADTVLPTLTEEILKTGELIEMELGEYVFAQVFLSVRFYHDRGDPYTKS